MGTDVLYGLDIETDTTIDGFDPSVAPIVAVAIAAAHRTWVFAGPEVDILRSVEATLRSLPPGILVTWNGTGFDLPFIAERARRLEVEVTLGGHRHLDGYRVYRADVGATLGLSCGLKAMARLVGLAPIEVDRSDICGLSATALDEYVASDAEVTRELVLRRWPACSPAAVPLSWERPPVSSPR